MAQLGRLTVTIENAASVNHLRRAMELSQVIAGRYPQDSDAEDIVTLLVAVVEALTVTRED